MTTADRDDLLSTDAQPHTTLDMGDGHDARAQAQRLLSVSDKLSDGQRRLEDSHRVALETEDLGAGILRDLRGQRDTLEHTRDNVSPVRRVRVRRSGADGTVTAVRGGRGNRASVEYRQENGEPVCACPESSRRESATLINGRARFAACTNNEPSRTA